MALVLIKEDGTGFPNANSYASVADGDAYHEAHVNATAWTTAGITKREAALVMATRLIDQEFQFNGHRKSEEQALQWPRVGCPEPDADPRSGDAMVLSKAVPRRVLDATCELARELLIADRTANPAGEGISMQHWPDGSEIIYNKRDRRPILSYSVQALLCKYGVLLKKAMTAVPLERA